MGYRLQLGHPAGDQCPLPQQAFRDDFTIINIDQVHTLGLDYCGCGHSTLSQVQQLLERRLYPATVENPKTAATFRVLEMFELLQYESKVSPFELWKTLSRMTDNTGMFVVKVCELRDLVENVTLTLITRRIDILAFSAWCTSGDTSKC